MVKKLNVSSGIHSIVSFANKFVNYISLYSQEYRTDEEKMLLSELKSFQQKTPDFRLKALLKTFRFNVNLNHRELLPEGIDLTHEDDLF